MAVVVATGASPAGQTLCAMLLDDASDLVATAPAEVITAVGGSAATVERLAAVALLAEICASCRLCPRGEAIAEAREAGPIGKQRARRRR